MKKIISLLLSAIMLITCVSGLSFSAYAESGTCGTNVNWEYDSASQTLSISGSGDMKDMTSMDDKESPWKDIRKNVKVLTIAEGVSRVGNYNFTFFTGIKEVTIPKSVTSMGNDIFYMCTSLESVTILGNVTEIKGSTFSLCKELKTVSIPASVTKIVKNAFNQCDKLTDVYYGGTKAQWNSITIGGENSALSKATIHYNEPEAPTQPSTAPSAQAPSSDTTEATKPAAATVKKPKATSISKLTKGSKQFKVTFKKISGVTGYQVQYSTDKKFKKGNKSVTVKGATKTSATVKKLKAKKTYYVRVRTYKTTNGKKSYSSWSKVKSVKTK